jgi:pimeloyl-ACP methyl ester carboxylesterase
MTSATSTGDRIDVPVAGGELATFRLGTPRTDAPVALAIHGITSSSRSWLAVADALGDSAALIAVDLRGRARSSQLPGPFGIGVHVADMVAVLDHFGLRPAVVVGHSLGAYIAAALEIAHPELVSSLVLVDGGLTIPQSVGVDPEQFTEAFLSATLARLVLTFPDEASYRAWWSAHPAIADSDIDAAMLDEYAQHDLVGEPPELRCSISREVVRQDAVDLFGSTYAESITSPAVLLSAPRGLVNEPSPMQPIALARRWAAEDPERRRAVEVRDVNHYTIAFGRHGAREVAAEVIAALQAAASPAA